ncbi:MAG: pyruvate kinase, partial [Clostridia bacterium]|nr:pyruvate kinase [Clostridia bacterium]
ESTIDYWRKLKRFYSENETMSVTDSISFATCTTAMSTRAKAIVTVTSSGKTARKISRFKPSCPIIAVTSSEKVLRQLNLAFGVVPVLAEEQHSTDELVAEAMRAAVSTGLVNPGDTTVITAGIPIGMSGTTNLLKVHIVGDVACYGLAIGKGSVKGRLCVASSVEEALKECKRGDILVTKYTIAEMLPAIKRCSALVVEESDMESHAVLTALELNKPIIIGVDNACKILKSEVIATLDMERGTIQYNSFE